MWTERTVRPQLHGGSQNNQDVLYLEMSYGWASLPQVPGLQEGTATLGFLQH